jgi:hypothetical protein
MLNTKNKQNQFWEVKKYPAHTSTYIVSSRLFNKKNTHATCKYRHNSVDICLELLQAEKPVQKLPAIKPTIREVASLHTT